MSDSDRFSEKARQILDELAAEASTAKGSSANPLILAALRGRRLDAMSDVARAYGEVLEGVYRQQREDAEGRNLIVNGSFEADGPTTNVSLAGWKLSGTRFCTLSTEGVTDGRLSAVFGDGTPQSQPPTAHSAAISQTVAAQVGARYRLACDWGVYGDAAESSAQSLGVRVTGGQTLLEDTATARGAIPGALAELSWEFVADAPAVTVIFADATTNGESGLADGVLDHVRLVQLGPDGRPLRPPAARPSEDPARAELAELVVGADSPTSISENDAVDFYLYESAVHDKIMQLRSRLNEHLADLAHAPPRAHTLVERAIPCEATVFVRGDPSRRGDAVPRRILQILGGANAAPATSGSGRLELAQAITGADNPLVARVLVNRVWQEHFGAGLVDSPSNFGLRSLPPSHPALLDYLAARFVAEGWSIKRLHRWILLSSTYQQASAERPECAELDPGNRWLWRMNRRRLDFESLRDAMLATSGRLDQSLGGPPIELTAADARRRTVYGRIDRQDPAGMLATFDFASPDAHTPVRHLTTVPQQALFLLNGPLILAQAAAFAERPDVAGIAARDPRIERMYRLALGRPPQPAELESIRAFLTAGGTWADLAQVLLASNEFSFVD